ncbi:major capsid protein [Alsobacter sp. R-9]
MISMDVFNSNAFSAVELTTALDKMDHVPSLLGGMEGLFEPAPVRTEVVWVEERSYAPEVLPTSPRGSAPHQTGGDARSARAFQTVRLADASRITAHELQNIRAFGSDSELKTVAEEVARRQVKMMANMQLTLENLRLGCVQGVVTDSDGSTIYNWATEFGVSIPTEVDFDLDNASPASGVLRQKCTAAVRSITRALKGKMPQKIVALCGDTFWDQLIAHPEVRDIYLGYAAAQDLAKNVAWESFRFGGIEFVNYRGTDDGSTVAIGATKAKFFPVGAGIFQWAMSPGESLDFVNTLGQPYYSQLVRDLHRNHWVDVELYAYPLPICTMPGALYQARNT